MIKDPMKSKSETKRNKAQLLVRTVLGVYCLRRTKDQEIRGKPIVVLPKKTILVRDLQLSRPEQALYDRLFRSGQSPPCCLMSACATAHVCISNGSSLRMPRLRAGMEICCG